MAIDDLDLEFEDEEEQKNHDAIEVDVDLSFSASGEHSPNKAQAGNAPGAPAGPQQPAKPPKLAISENDVTDPNFRVPSEFSNNKQSNNNQKDSHDNQKPSISKPAAGTPGQVKSLDEARKSASQASQQVAHAPVQTTKAKVLDQRKPAAQTHSRPTPSPSDESAAAVGHYPEIQELREEIQGLKEEMRSMRSIQHGAEVKVAIAEAKAEFIAEYMSNAKLMDHQVSQILQRIHGKVPQVKNEVLTIKKYVGEFIKKSGGK